MEAIPGCYHAPTVEGVSFPMAIDRGSAAFIISENKWKYKLQGLPLRPSSAVLKMVAGESVMLLDDIDVHACGAQ